MTPEEIAEVLSRLGVDHQQSQQFVNTSTHAHEITGDRRLPR